MQTMTIHRSSSEFDGTTVMVCLSMNHLHTSMAQDVSTSEKTLKKRLLELTQQAISIEEVPAV